MTDGILSDIGVADQLAAGFEKVSFADASDLPYPALSTSGGLVEAVSLGNSLKGTFADLLTVVNAKADNLRDIAAAFEHVDQQLSGGVP